MNMEILEIVITGIVVIIALTFHEFAHGLASYSLGDNTAKNEGRLTLNPFAHVDLFGLIMLFIIKFGWAKPVPINPYAYKNRRSGIIITSFAGPFANILLAFITYFILMLLGKFGYDISMGVFTFFQIMIVLNVNLAIFNLIPIPPLDGSKIFAEIFGGKVAEIIYRIEGKGMIILILLLFLPPFRSALSFLSMSVISGINSIIGVFL